MTDEKFAQMFDGMFSSIKGFVGRALAPVSARLDAVEKLAPLKGEPGVDGKDGAPGIAGENGRDGSTGAAGEPGRQGEKGIDGQDGAAGKDGARGDKGEPGQPGRDGVDGKPGAQGERGVDGAQGPRGEAGLPGENGLDGRNGIDGKDGADGINGKDGAPGARGAAGLAGERGEKGLDGVAGKDGAEGRDGREGEPGRDAIHIDVLDGIDAAKRYPRGTYAAWRGGIVRSFRATDPIDGDKLEKCGWHVVVNGIDSESEEERDEGRLLVRTTRYTNGQAYIRQHARNIFIDRGVYRSGQSAKAGDGCTYGGSYWIATQDTDESPTGPSHHWRLAVKGTK